MNQSITIPKEPPSGSALSYDFLHEEGIRHLQQLAGATWTDYNVHDPGLTILEQVCYAMTDLAYRIGFDVGDLIHEEGPAASPSLFGPAALLTGSPVTFQDLRKIIIDLPGVKNAWVEKVASYSDPETGASIPLKGLYQVLFEADEWAASDGDLSALVRARLHASRNIGEDIREVRFLVPQPVRLQGAIELGRQVEDVDQLVAEILHQVGALLSPRISFHSLPQMLEKGKRIEEIFDGPALMHGFIEEEELLRHPRIKEVQISDIIREIMDVPGVKEISSSFALATGVDTVKKWVLPIDSAKTPRLDVNGTLRELVFTIGGIPVTINQAAVTKRYGELGQEGLPKKLPAEARDVVPAAARDRNLSQYHSLQYHFPANYGLGSYDLPEGAPERRHAQAKQLKAYLAFFEQLLANHFSQLAHFKDLLRFDSETQTHFNQSLVTAIHGLKDVLVSEEQYADYLKEMAAETVAGLKQKNQLLNHLLARFGEDFAEYGLTFQADVKNEALAKKLIRDKVAFLKAYPELSGDRTRAFDYTQPAWDTENISGLEKRIAAKLGMEDTTRRHLARGNTEGFHMVEHTLLKQGKQIAVDPFEDFLGEITTVEQTDQQGMIRCIAPGHNLQAGDHFFVMTDASMLTTSNVLGYLLYGMGLTHNLISNRWDKIYQVEAVEADSFLIRESFDDWFGLIESSSESSSELPDSFSWRVFRKRTPDDLFFETSGSVYVLSSAIDDETITHSEINVLTAENLSIGEKIEIFGTNGFDGVFEVIAPQENIFKVGNYEESGFTLKRFAIKYTQALPATKPYLFHDFSKGYLRRVSDGPVLVAESQSLFEQGPGSMEVTFALPDFIGRFADVSFRRLTEQIIREETPAHLKVNIQWMGQEDLEVFEQEYEAFLSNLKARV